MSAIAMEKREAEFIFGSLLQEPTVNAAKIAKRRKVQPRAAVAIYPGRLAPQSILARVGLEKALAKQFRPMRRKTIKAVNQALKLPHEHIAKVTEDEAAAAAAVDATLKALARDWQAIADSADTYLTEAALAGANLGGLQLEITSEGMLGGINTVAGDWAANRAAELVGMQRTAAGKLIVNPNPKWAITDTTRDKLREVIKDLFGKEQASLRDVETAIEQAGIFDDKRASMIARTEITRAQTQGNLLSWQMSGVVQQVAWQLSVDHDKDDICDDLAGGGPYPIMKVPELPAHPSCMCALVLVVPGAPEEE